MTIALLITILLAAVVIGLVFAVVARKDRGLNPEQMKQKEESLVRERGESVCKTVGRAK